MSQARFMKFVSVLSLIFALSSLSMAITNKVGYCNVRGGINQTFATIQAALSASPAPNYVVVCPGTYHGQIVITQPVTLEGIGAGRAIIAPPAGGLQTSVYNPITGSIAAQIWVNNATGPVTIKNLTIDGTGNGVANLTSSPFNVGIYFQNSFGTVDSVTTRNQTGNYQGVGIFADGGAASPSVTVENSSIHDFDFAGINVPNALALNLTISNNTITLNNPAFGIQLLWGVTANVMNNTISGGGESALGMYTAASGSASGNTFINIGSSVAFVTDPANPNPMSITSNKFLNNVLAAVVVENGLNSNSVANTVTGNWIVNAPEGIEFNCIYGPNITGNSFNEVGYALLDVATGVNQTANSIFSNVDVVQSGCGN